MVSTPNAPEGLFERIERACIYISIPSSIVGLYLGKIYMEDEIQAAKQSPSFEREYYLALLGLVGWAFHPKDIEAAIERGKKFSVQDFSGYTQKSLGIDLAWGSSPFGICITELKDGIINVLYSE